MAIETPKTRKTVKTIEEADLKRFYDTQKKIEEAEEKLKKAKEGQKLLGDELVEAIKAGAVIDSSSKFIASLKGTKSRFSPSYKDLFSQYYKEADKVVASLKAAFKPEISFSLVLYKKDEE